MRRVALALAVSLTLLGLALVLPRVGYHARSEEVFEGPARTLADAAGAATLDLGAGTLEEGQSVVFEVCSADGFPSARWRGRMTLEVWHAVDGERIVESALDDAHLARVRRAEAGGCLVVANAASLGVAGPYAIVARLGASSAGDLLDVPLRARIVASRPTNSEDLAGLVALLGASILWIVALASGPRRASATADALVVALGGDPPSKRPIRPDLRAAFAWAMLALALFGVGFVTGSGPFAALFGSAILAGVQLATATTLAAPGDPSARRAVLALGLDGRRSRVLAALAPFLGLALVLAGRYAGALVPSTSESAIETYVESHSGYLAVASSALLLPLVEELFFRGLLYGLFERAWNAGAATVAVVLAFPLLHLPQVAGAWGALLSLAITGAGLTLLRRTSGSVVPGMIAHLAHNAAIAFMSFPV